MIRIVDREERCRMNRRIESCVNAVVGFVTILIAFIAVIAVCALMSGCGTARQHLYMGQGLDYATTDYALDHGFSESNPLAETSEDVLIMKAVVIGLVELAAWWDKENADTYYWVGAFAGYSAGAWNVHEISRH